MTGLPNARSLQMQFEKEVGRASRSATSFQVLMLDLDGFKGVNDNFGHKAGDEMLREISKVIRQQMRDYDFLARYGGDEFVALIPETSPGDVSDLCDRIEKAVCSFKLPVADDQYASVGVSLGSAGYPASGETFDQMIIAADKIMYERKVNRKRLARIAQTDLISRPVGHPMSNAGTDGLTDDTLIVELDESHVITSSAVN